MLRFPRNGTICLSQSVFQLVNPAHTITIHKRLPSWTLCFVPLHAVYNIHAHMHHFFTSLNTSPVFPLRCSLNIHTTATSFWYKQLKSFALWWCRCNGEVFLMLCSLVIKLVSRKRREHCKYQASCSLNTLLRIITGGVARQNSELGAMKMQMMCVHMLVVHCTGRSKNSSRVFS